MKSIMNRLQKDLQKLHKTIAKESEEILKRQTVKNFEITLKQQDVSFKKL